LWGIFHFTGTNHGAIVKKGNEMKRTLIITTTLAALTIPSVGPLLANQSGAGSGEKSQTEALKFLAAEVSLQQATDIALEQVAGTLSAIGFEDEDGRGLYEATIVAADGATSLVKIDASTGAVLGSGLVALIDDETDDDEDDEGDEGWEAGDEDDNDDQNDGDDA
jgi:peptidase YpeB-like protein